MGDLTEEQILTKLGTAGTPHAIADGAAGVQVTGLGAGTKGRLLGWSILSTDAATGVTVALYDGVDNTGTYLGGLSLNPGSPPESDRDWFGPQGITFANGIYADKVGGGTVKGTVYTGPA